MIRRFSPAKVNLHLRVLRKREDGYHDLATLMQRIDLQDEMTFDHRDGGIHLTCPGHPELENDDNLAVRAARALIRETSWRGGFQIGLFKHIPLAAGLGGGSSNAASTLVALNDLMGQPCSREILMGIGARIGADVPFFIFEKTAWAFGIGDRLEAAPPLPPLFFLLINPGFELSTKSVYEGLNFTLTKEPIHYSIPRFLNAREVVKGLHNDLEEVSVKRHPVIGELKTLLLHSGAPGALMSGSGPTVFGVFEREEERNRTGQVLEGAVTWPLLAARSL